MKRFRKAPLLWMMLISFLLLTAVSVSEYASESQGKKLDTINVINIRNVIKTIKTKDIIKEPLLTHALQNIEKGILPFHLEQYFQQEAEQVNAVGEESVEQPLTDQESTHSRNELTEDERENSVSENEVPKQYEYQLVEKAYFDDAVFIGDSRTDGLARYSGLDNATFYAKNSLTIFDFFDKRFIPVEGTSEKLTLEEAMEQKQYGKIYIMFGINELGSCTRERFGAEYLRVLTRIRELQPNAILFVQGMMRVTAAKSTTDPTYNNVNINIRNALLATIDNHHDVFYLEMNDAVCDENGDLNSAYTFDDVHLKAKYYDLWVDYLMEHGIVQD